MRSTPIAKLSCSEKFLECFANTGVKTPLNAIVCFRLLSSRF